MRHCSESRPLAGRPSGLWSGRRLSGAWPDAGGLCPLPLRLGQGLGGGAPAQDWGFPEVSESGAQGTPEQPSSGAGAEFFSRQPSPGGRGRSGPQSPLRPAASALAVRDWSLFGTRGVQGREPGKGVMGAGPVPGPLSASVSPLHLPAVVGSGRQAQSRWGPWLLRTRGGGLLAAELHPRALRLPTRRSLAGRPSASSEDGGGPALLCGA